MTGEVWIGSVCGGMRACAACFDADHVRDHGHPGLCHVKGCRTRDGGECAIRYAGAEEPMDTKPLRQEDYQAMAERARRAEAELAQLKAKDQKAPSAIGRGLATALMLGALVLGITIGYATSADWHDHTLPRVEAQLASTAKRTTACYFIRRVDGKKEPWKQDWRVFRSDHSGALNDEVTDRQGYKTTYSSSLEAWRFIMGWGLEACR